MLQPKLDWFEEVGGQIFTHLVELSCEGLEAGAGICLEVIPCRVVVGIGAGEQQALRINQPGMLLCLLYTLTLPTKRIV